MIKLLFRLMLCSLVLFQAGLFAVYAQEPEEEETPLVIEQAGQLNVTLKQFGHRMVRLDRDNPEYYYQLDIPHNLQVLPTGNYFDLTTSHFPPTPGQTSLLDVEMNDGTIISTIVLTASNSLSHTTRIDIPERLLKPGRNYIMVRLNEEICGQPEALVDVSISDQSALNFNYQQVPYPTDLALYPFPFVTDLRQRLLNVSTTIVLPDTPTPTELSVAATVAAGLGEMSGGRIDLTAATVSNLEPEIRAQNHLIFIGQPDRNSLLKELNLPLSLSAGTVQPGQGVLQEVASPWNEFRVALAVSGLDEEGLVKAGFALNRQAHFLGMRGPIAVVVELLPLPKAKPSQGTSMTLKSLDYQDQIVYGVKARSYTYNFDLPLGWRLEDLPYFALKFSHADILDPYQSMIDVRLNDVPISSALLDSNNATAGQLTVSLPRRLLATGRNRLTVGVEMHLIDEDNCRDADAQRAWTVINSESEIFLPYNAVDVAPNLNLLPYPFSQGDGFDQTLFVLPDQPTPQTFNDLMGMAILLGSPSKAEYISAHVDYASSVTKDVAARHHLILLGRPTQNSLLAEANNSLPHPFVPESDLLKPLALDSVAFAPNPNRDAGLLELAQSPWNEQNSLLAVTGTTDQGYRLAIDTLLAGKTFLEGNLAVIEPSVSPFAAQPAKVSTYYIDTRASLPDNEESSATGASAGDLPSLANRWWK